MSCSPLVLAVLSTMDKKVLLLLLLLRFGNCVLFLRLGDMTTVGLLM